MNWRFIFAITLLAYATAFGYMFRFSVLCSFSDDPTRPQSEFAYGFHPNPIVNDSLSVLFAPFLSFFDPDVVIPDPGDFSATSGHRMGFDLLQVLWASWIGKLVLIILLASLFVVAKCTLPFLYRTIKLSMPPKNQTGWESGG